MKRTVLSFMIFMMVSVLLLFSDNVQAQTVPVENPMRELILGVPKANEKNFFLITEAIGRVKGVTFYQYCPVHQLILVKYDPAVYKKSEEVVAALQEAKLNMPVLIKEGTFEEAKELCAN